jgi:hypothetical protein
MSSSGLLNQVYKTVNFIGYDDTSIDKTLINIISTNITKLEDGLSEFMYEIKDLNSKVLTFESQIREYSFITLQYTVDYKEIPPKIIYYIKEILSAYISNLTGHKIYKINVKVKKTKIVFTPLIRSILSIKLRPPKPINWSSIYSDKLDTDVSVSDPRYTTQPIYVHNISELDLNVLSGYRLVDSDALAWYSGYKKDFIFINWNGLPIVRIDEYQNEEINNLRLDTKQYRSNGVIPMKVDEDSYLLLLEKFEMFKINILLERLDLGYFFIERLQQLHDVSECLELINIGQAPLLLIRQNVYMEYSIKNRELLFSIAEKALTMIGLDNLINKIQILADLSIKVPLYNITQLHAFETCFFTILNGKECNTYYISDELLDVEGVVYKKENNFYILIDDEEINLSSSNLNKFEVQSKWTRGDFFTPWAMAYYQYTNKISILPLKN